MSNALSNPEKAEKDLTMHWGINLLELTVRSPCDYLQPDPVRQPARTGDAGGMNRCLPMAIVRRQ